MGIQTNFPKKGQKAFCNNVRAENGLFSSYIFLYLYSH